MEFDESKRKYGIPRRTRIQPEEGELEDVDSSIAKGIHSALAIAIK